MAEKYDVVVIGGGISGLGVAREAAFRGYKIALIEKAECCGATSNNSLRIIHGGLRYLQNGDLIRVFESARAQAELLKQYPDLISPLPCLMPLKRTGLQSWLPVSAALLAYRAVQGMIGVSSERNEVVSPQWVDQHVATVQRFAPQGALLWHDAQLLDPAGLCSALKREIAEQGGVVREHSEASVRSEAGSPFAISIKNERSKAEEELQARVVVNTTGPWAFLSTGTLSLSRRHGRIQGAKAFNLLLNRQIEPKYALALRSREGRLLFLTPRTQQSATGTWYLPYNGVPDGVGVSKAEIESAVADLNFALPGLGLSTADVGGVEVGILPARGFSGINARLYGSEKIFSSAGYIEVLSTKYTTFLMQARKVLRLVESFL